VWQLSPWVFGGVVGGAGCFWWAGLLFCPWLFVSFIVQTGSAPLCFFFLLFLGRVFFQLWVRCGPSGLGTPFFLFFFFFPVVLGGEGFSHHTLGFFWFPFVFFLPLPGQAPVFGFCCVFFSPALGGFFCQPNKGWGPLVFFFFKSFRLFFFFFYFPSPGKHKRGAHFDHNTPPTFGWGGGFPRFCVAGHFPHRFFPRGVHHNPCFMCGFFCCWGGFFWVWFVVFCFFNKTQGGGQGVFPQGLVTSKISLVHGHPIFGPKWWGGAFAKNLSLFQKLPQWQLTVWFLGCVWWLGATLKAVAVDPFEI